LLHLHAYSLPPHRRLLVGISGIPASGKSTLAARIVAHANRVLGQPLSASSIRVDAGIDGPGTVLRALDRVTTLGAAHAILVGLDGWHLSRAQLDTLPDPTVAHARRGAHWTFDGRAYVDFVRVLRQEVAVPHSAVRATWHKEEEGGMSTNISAPSFDHALKDPSPSTVTIHPSDRIVVIEGLYTFLNLEPWAEAGKLLDERWLIELDEEEARERLVKRHVLTGVTKNLEEAYRRADENDMPSESFS
jgi:pantothenate kinase